MPVMITNENGEPIGIDYPEYFEPEYDDTDMSGYFDDDDDEEIDAQGDSQYPETDLGEEWS